MGQSLENVQDVLNMGLDLCQVTIHLFLVLSVVKWQREESDNANDEQSKAIEQFPHKCHQVQQSQELKGLKNIFNKDEFLQSVEGRQEHNNGFPRVVLSLFSTQSHIQVHVCFEGVFSVTPVECVEDLVVDAY